MRPLVKDFLWPHRFRFLLGFGLILVGRAATLVPPAAAGTLIDDVLNNGNSTLLYWLTAAIGVSVVIRAAVHYANTILLNVKAQEIIAEIRLRVHRHLLTLPVSFFDASQSGGLAARAMNDVRSLKNLIGAGFVVLIEGGITALAVLAFMLILDPILTLLIVGLYLGFVFVYKHNFEPLNRAFETHERKNTDMTGRFAQTMMGIYIVKGFDALEEKNNRFARGANRLFGYMKDFTQKQGVISSYSIFFTGMTVVVLTAYGGSQVINGSSTLGAFVSFSALVVLLAGPVRTVAFDAARMAEAFVGLERVSELLALRPEGKEARRTIVMPPIKGHIAFEDVHFRYTDDEPVLRGISFDVRPGTVAALIGSSGAGKSTIAGLAALFREPDRGRVLVDGIDLGKVELQSYRRQLGLVLQDNVLFDGTILQNIRLPKPGASDAEVRQAAEQAYVTEFSDSLKDGLDTVIGERGIKLSGGQRQRVAIARAVLADPRIFILDEATSSMDTESEALIQRSLAKLMRGRTTLVIAHRLSTIQRADVIFVVEDGRIVEQGTHDSLMAQTSRYHQLYTVQARI